jgi:CheY-like chemotaxis protein
MTLESEPFRIDRLLRNLSVVLSANVGAKSLDILFDVDPALPPVLRGDAMRLQQVLINLGGNAVKFTSEGQVVLSLRLLGQTTEAATIEFAVKDTGIGIAPEHQDRIFSGFSQAEGSTTRRFGGAGLGLAISKRFVELMGGAMQLRSAPGVGSTFSFVLELPTVSEVPQDLRESAPQAMEPQRVLVVDDNPLAGELTLAMVQSWGWSAELASSGKQAVELVEAQCKQGGSQFPYPVIYTDWRLPDIDGWETSRRIRQLARTHGLPQPTIIMVTAQGREMLAQRPEGDQDLLNGFMVKPVTAPMMYDALLDAVSGKSGLRKMTKGRSNARQLSGMRILVVEDNLINQQVADELLSAAGAIVSLATNGQIGVEAVAAAAPQFDVVLMDVQMPVLDGYGATRAIREELGMKTLPIIAMTANAMASDREVCLAAGMSEHIGKPFEMAKLVSMLLRMTGFQVQEAVALDALPEGAAAATELPEIAGLELATAVARMAGMRALYLRTARDFLRILDGTVTELRDGLAKGNRALLAMRLHTLKGNAATLGAMAMAGRAAAMETLCKTDAGMQACVQEMDSFEALVASTRQLLQQAIAALGGNIAVTADASPAQANVAAQAVLQQLTALTAADDLQALAYFAEQRSMLSNLPGDWLDRMDQALQDLDLASAHALAQDMLQQAAVP